MAKSIKYILPRSCVNLQSHFFSVFTQFLTVQASVILYLIFKIHYDDIISSALEFFVNSGQILILNRMFLTFLNSTVNLKNILFFSTI